VDQDDRRAGTAILVVDLDRGVVVCSHRDERLRSLPRRSGGRPGADL